MDGKALTAKQQAFVAALAKGMGKAEAAIAAGCPAKSAHVSASRMLKNAKVSAALERVSAKAEVRAEVDAATVLRELALLALSRSGRIRDEILNKPPAEWSEETQACIAGMKIRRETEGKGDDATEFEVIEYKLWDKNSALEKLCRKLKLYGDAGSSPDEPLHVKFYMPSNGRNDSAPAGTARAVPGNAG